MAQKYIIVSDDTYTSLALPDTVVLEWGLPITSTDEEGEEESLTYTLETGIPAASLGSSPPFPIEVRDPLPPLRDGEFKVTDWVVPLNGLGGNMDLFVLALSSAKGVPYLDIALSNKQCRNYLATGDLPTAVI